MTWDTGPWKVPRKMITLVRSPSLAESGQSAVPHAKVPKSDTQPRGHTPVIPDTHHTAPARLRHLLLWDNSGILLYNFQCLVCTWVAKRRSSPVLIITMGIMWLLGQLRIMATPPPTVRWKASFRLNNKGQRVGREGEFPTRYLLLQEQVLRQVKHFFSL